MLDWDTLAAVHQPSQDPSLPVGSVVPPTLSASGTYTLQHLVDCTNLHHLDQLPSPLYEYQAVDSASHPQSLCYYSDMPVDIKLSFKVGTQVMLCKNLGGGLVNGSIGTIISFHQVEKIFGSRNGHAGCPHQWFLNVWLGVLSRVNS